MADFWTHVLHGVEVLNGLKDNRSWLKKRDLFFLGLQGPDIFFYAYDKPEIAVWGGLIHKQRCGEFMEDLLSSQRLPREYAFGFLCHQVMDRFAHRFIDHFEDFKSHKRKEMAIDVALVRRSLGRRYEQLKPWKLVESVDLRELPSEFSRIVRRVYGNQSFKSETFELAVSKTASTLKMLYEDIEKTRRKAYRYWILSLGGKDYTHLVPPKKLKDPLNEKHDPWIDPVTQKQRRESFLEVFKRAVEEAIGSIELVLRGGMPDTINRNFETDEPC
ncbi:MAG: hypothetical protein DRP27_04165 [Thermotogae bacterium]|nr:zinc dependent phospholipase C family protein [Thermotogota bacterium]RKX45431.1 MAG: hypothetical protein DRP27_04165 [Thermotogota bacterium]